MATVAVLNTLVTANTNPFSKAMSGVGRTLTGTAVSMRSLIKVASGIGAAFAAFVGVRSAITGVADAMRNIDADAKTAERVGLTAEAMAGLKHQASLAGVEFTAVSTGLGRMSRTVVDATNGMATAKLAFDTLGLSADALLSLSPEEAFKRIADALSRIENPMLRAATAQQIFGRGGAELLPILNAGRAGIEAARKEAEQFGLAVSGVDAAQVEAANDAFTRVKGIITGINNAIAVNLAPFLEEIALRAQRFAIEGGGAGTIVSAAFEGVAVSITQSMRVLDLLMGAWHALRATVAGVVGFVIKAIGMMAESIIDALNQIPGVAITFNSTLYDIGDAMLDVASEAAEKSAAAFGSAFTGSRVEAVKEFFHDVQERARLAAEAVEAQREKLRTVSASALNVESDITGVADAINGLDLSVSTIDQMPDAITKAASAFEDRAFGVTSRDSFAGARAAQGFGTFLGDKGEDRKIASNTKQTVEELKRLANAMKQLPWVPAPL